MCGIAGIFNYNHSEKINLIELNNMNHHMHSRGPDDSGIWVNSSETIGLAHRRLSIIDLSQNAKQPMQLQNSELVITFNGEIYNFQEIKKNLMQDGYCFKTHSDTEVILALYQKYNVNMLKKLRGMFALAIWDEKNKTLFCARDPFGIKPFYFSDNQKSFRFASQVKTLLAGGSNAVDTKPNAAGKVGFYLLGSVPEPHTLYQGISTLPAGNYLCIDQNGKKTQKEYYSIKSVLINAENNLNHSTSFSETLSEVLYDTVRHHLVSDVNVGVFLSAGIDSSTLVNVASEISNQKITTITLGFDEYRYSNQDEVPLAEIASSYFKTNQKTEYILEKYAQAEYENIIATMDQPSIDGMNTYFVSQIAARNGLKVALSGIGADEIFFGYPHFSRISTQVKYLKYYHVAGKLCRHVLKKYVSAKYASLFEYSNNISSAYFLSRALHLPWELDFIDPAFLKTGLEQLNLLERFKHDIADIQSIPFQISALELQWYMRNQLLRDSDWASMAHSLEIRVPFVDTVFFEAVTKLSANNFLNKKALANAAHRSLPTAILNKPKTGFNIPVKKWFAHDASMKNFSKMIDRHFT